MYIPKGVFEFILGAIAATLLVFLIVVCVRLLRLIRSVNTLIAANRQNIDETLKVLPETAKNINDVSVLLKENIGKAGIAINGIKSLITGSGSEDDDDEPVGPVTKILSFVGEVATLISMIRGLIEAFTKNDD